MKRQRLLRTTATVFFVLVAAASLAWANGKQEAAPPTVPSANNHPGTTTPIQHVVVIFDENISFDHYFATYPRAANPNNEPPFYPVPGTPAVNGLDSTLLHDNPNGVNPQRLDRSQPMTADMDHGYTAEQSAFDGGLMNKFVADTGHNKKVAMDYYDGNSVTALWNYAQHFAMSDNSFGAPVMSVGGKPGLPVAKIAHALGLKPDQLSATEILFQPIQS